MAPEIMTLAQIQSKGLDLLARELGPVGLIRFLQQFDPGSGDYTAERHEWLGDSTVEGTSLTNWDRLKAMTDEDIDFSDTPEITPEMFDRAVVTKARPKADEQPPATDRQ